ncbi:MAG TPA: S41 family peptidase [Clostridiaceae bacterium]|nr:S41 family peptidase [Clostridiaceae bacterium]
MLPNSAFASGTTNISAEYLERVFEVVKENYNGEITDGELLQGALKGMFNTMDPYTVYFTKDEADTFLSGIGGIYEGIGVSFEKDGDYVVIIDVYKSSPAERSGLVPGDNIVSVDGKSIAGMPVEQVQSMILGKAGTKVVLGIMRAGEKDILEVEIIREQIKINPVIYDIRGDIGYIRIKSINSNTDQFLTEALNEMDDKKIEKIILDLRDNPGGDVSQAVAAARKFVPEGLITKLDYKSEKIPDEVYYSYLKEPKYKLAVLVNGATASAAEILAGAIQDSGAGKLIGTKTFGKAKVQNIMPLLTPEAYKKYELLLGIKTVNAYEIVSVYGIALENEDIIGWAKMTTAVYLTPKGRIIDGKGLKPDITISDPQLIDNIDIKSIQKLSLTVKPTLNSMGYDVYNAEKILKILGYEVDEPDTKLDEKTYKAIYEFQRDSGLFPYGVLDFTTQKALNEKLEQIILSNDRQYAKAVDILNTQ